MPRWSVNGWSCWPIAPWGPFAAAVRLGLPLATVRNASALLERARQTDDDIVAIHVFDTVGAIVHSTDPVPPATISTDIMAARSVASGQPWYRQTAQGFMSSVDIAGADSTSAGGILVAYPDGSLTQVRAMLAELVLAALAVLLAAAVLGALLLHWGLVGVIRRFDGIDVNPKFVRSRLHEVFLDTMVHVSRFSIVINMQVAKKLRLMPPLDLLQIAETVN